MLQHFQAQKLFIMCPSQVNQYSNLANLLGNTDVYSEDIWQIHVYFLNNF